MLNAINCESQFFNAALLLHWNCHVLFTSSQSSLKNEEVALLIAEYSCSSYSLSFGDFPKTGQCFSHCFKMPITGS